MLLQNILVSLDPGAAGHLHHALREAVTRLPTWFRCDDTRWLVADAGEGLIAALLAAVPSLAIEPYRGGTAGGVADFGEPFGDWMRARAERQAAQGA